jgi:hypothetical protein
MARDDAPDGAPPTITSRRRAVARSAALLSPSSPSMETRSFLAMLAGGMALLALGGAIGGNRDAMRSSVGPLGMLFKGAGLALLTYAIYRLVKGNL